MYHAFFALSPNIFLLFVFSCINISETGGATGVTSKWYSPSIVAHADSRGLWLHFLTMLILKSTCGINLHQYAIGNVGGNDATVDFMYDLYVWIDRSAGFFSMHVWRCVLLAYLLDCNEGLNISWRFIIHFMWLWPKASALTICINFFVSS